MDFGATRRNMVECQLRTSGVADEALLAAMGSVPRERFVPDALQEFAYVDEDLAIGGGRYLMEPAVLGGMIQLAAIGAADVVLDIGSGTGYAVTVLSQLAGTVFALENEPALATRAGDLHAELAPDNVVPVECPLTAGCVEHAPFDVILIEGAVEEIPQAILEQLGEGGRLVAVVMNNGVGRVTVVHRIGDHFSRRITGDARIPMLEEFRRPAAFVL